VDQAQMPRAFNTVVNPNMEVKRLPPEESRRPGAYGRRFNRRKDPRTLGSTSGPRTSTASTALRPLFP
jgi:hypothetical protein